MRQEPSKELIQNAFSQFSNFPDEVWEFCKDNWQKLTYSKGEVLLEAGSIEKYLTVVQSGIQRIAYPTSEGAELTLGFSFAPSFSGAYDSLLYQRPSIYSLEALTDSVVWGITYKDLMNLFDHFQSMDRWGREFAQQILIGRGKREIELLTMTAAQRFHAFAERSPKELFDIPQKYLASYLNMTPETFSRIRAERT